MLGIYILDSTYYCSQYKQSGIWIILIKQDACLSLNNAVRNHQYDRNPSYSLNKCLFVPRELLMIVIKLFKIDRML